MALYGLSVFVETPEQLRKGRKRYIATSFVITCLSALTAALDMSGYFQVLFGSTSPFHWQKLMQISHSNWSTLFGDTALSLLVWIGDALLVSVYSHCVRPWSSWNTCSTGVSLLCDLRQLLMGSDSTWSYLCVCIRSVMPFKSYIEFNNEIVP